MDKPSEVDISALEVSILTIKDLTRGKSNDFSCAVERFAVDVASETGKIGFRDQDLVTSNANYSKFLEESKLKPAEVETVTRKLKQSSKPVEETQSEAICDPRTTTCSYGSFSQKLPSKIFYPLTDAGSDEEVCAALMRVAAMNPGGQQLSMPFEWFEAVQKTIGLNLIGYASILNRYPGVPYCSIFEEDKKFGSLGNYHNLDLKAFMETQGDHIVVTQNPPFTETSLSKAASMAEKVIATAKSLGKNATVIVTGPAWKDAEFYLTLSKSKWLKKSFFLAKSKHYYENPSDVKGGKVVAKANSQLFVLSTMPMKNNKDYQFLFDVFSNV